MAVLLPLVINGKFGDMPAASPAEDGQFRVWRQSTGQFVPFDGMVFDTATGDIFVLNLPTSDPGVANQLWMDGSGFLRISTGIPSLTGQPIGLLLALTYV